RSTALRRTSGIFCPSTLVLDLSDGVRRPTCIGLTSMIARSALGAAERIQWPCRHCPHDDAPVITVPGRRTMSDRSSAWLSQLMSAVPHYADPSRTSLDVADVPFAA